MNNVYTDLDTLIDMRYNLLNSLNSDLIKEYINTENYVNRVSDDHLFLDHKTFYDFYRNRDRDILEPNMSNIKTTIDELLVKLKVLSVMGDKPTPKLIVNIYPYILARSEIFTLELMLKSMFDVDVEFIESNLLSTSYVNDNIAAMVIYDGIKWLEQIATVENLYSNTMPDTILIVPMDKNLLAPNIEYKLSSFNYLVTMYRPVIDLRFGTYKTFSYEKK